jgi:hypothetical protein
LQIAVLFVTAAFSMFINETTIVLVFMPVVLGVCKERNLSPSRRLRRGGAWTSSTVERSANRILRMLSMKGYWTLSLGLLAFCTAKLVTGCESSSGWGCSLWGIQLQQDGPPPPTPETPIGSGAVGYIPQDNF